jgi:hypothetical protein
MIAVGKYRARCTSHEHGKSATKGTRFIRLHFEILSEGHEGETIYWDGWITEKTIERFSEALEACGWDCGSFADVRGLGSIDCQIEVEHETNPENGKVYAKVKWVNKLGGGGKIKEEHLLPKNEKANLDQEFKAALIERRQNRAANPPKAATSRPASAASEDDFGPIPDDSDIPF